VLNLDLLAFAAAFLVLTAVLALVWRLVRGRAATPWSAAARVAVASGVALVVVAAGAYWLMNSRTLQVTGRLVSHVQSGRREVALTFDDGPNARYVDVVLGDLAKYEARGTFFVVGSEAEREQVALRKLVAAGEEMGNHSYTHLRLVGVTVGRVADEVERTDAVIRAGGYRGEILFRPPYCKKLVSEPYYLATNDRTSVTWDLEPDSLEGLAGDPEAMTQYVVDNVHPGSIILLHPWYERGDASRRALPLILEALAAKGYAFVTVSELLAPE
jgi:peptidoglycan-N-acetylglucosamine deacetylase